MTVSRAPSAAQLSPEFTAVPLVLRDFGDEIVVFNEATWDTHVLNAAAADVLQLLIEQPRSAAEVAGALQGWLESSEASDAEAHAVRLLDELQELGLIDAMSPQ